MADSELDGAVGSPTLRADLLTPVVVVPPGEPVVVELQVLNTTPVIETVEVRLLDVVPETIVAEPARVTLFPDESERIRLEMTFHRTLPAGTHEGVILVGGTSPESVPAELVVQLEVPPVSDLALKVEPPLRVGGKKARYEVTVENTGNTQLPLQLRAEDADKVLNLYLNRPSVRLDVDHLDESELTVKGKRPWTGAPVEHVITVVAERDELAAEQQVRFRQKARLTAGVITILTLALILTLWAFAMYFGVMFALMGEPDEKSIPESFMEGVGLANLDPTAVGGSITGTVLATSTGDPLPRVTVEAFDVAGDLISATATGDDGGYELAGLLPARYRLRIRAEGFETIWWPEGPDPEEAEVLNAPPMDVLGEIDANLTGLPGSLGGQAVLPDNEPIPVQVQVEAVFLLEDREPDLLTTDEAGQWVLTGLPTPAEYRITYSAPGFAPVEVVEPLGGGEQVVANPVRLEAALGRIEGVVRDRRTDVPLGNVEVTALRGDTEVGTVTPTSGEIGAFTLADLETPGTYLLTFSLEGYSPETVAVRLAPGEALSGFEVTLAAATGEVNGRVVSADGADLGGVTVTVSGGGTVLTTESFTSGVDQGRFRVAGLPVPGDYTVTFDLEGFGRETNRVQLTRDQPSVETVGVLTSSFGRIVGRVLDADGRPVQGVTVAASDGEQLRETVTTTSPPEQAGRFSFTELEPGSYTVTAVLAEDRTLTVLVQVRPAATAEVELRDSAAPG